MVNMIRSDLEFILAQIKIAEADAQGIDLVQSGLVPNSELPWGLRHVDGSNNNLIPGQEHFGSAGQPFPRGTDPSFTAGTGGQAFGPPIMDAGVPVNFGFPGVPPGYIPYYAFVAGDTVSPNGTQLPAGYQANYLTNNVYGEPDANNNPNSRAIQPGDVVDANPRIISNLVVDQTLNNPAAVFKALQDAGLEDDPATAVNEVVAAMEEIMAAVSALKTVRASVNATTTTNAYTVAITAIDNPNPLVLTDLQSLADAADAATQLQPLPQDSTVTVADVNAVNNAKAAVDALLAKASQILSILNGSGVNAPAADKMAVQNYIDTVSYTKLLLDNITITAGQNVNVTDNLAAIAAQNAGNGLDLAAALEAQLSNTLTSINAAASAAASTIGTLESNLRGLLESHGIATDNTPGNTDILKETLYIGNVAADEGLSAPFNGWMTLFGQFFDHGLDLVAKGGFGTVYIPLQPDDPLYRPNSPSNFMAITRSTIGPDGEPINKITPFVDQNQTYTSHPAHQFFLREYELRDGKPVATGRLLNGSAESGGGLATWADVKTQALTILGIELNDHNIHSVPEIIVDAYGNFIPGDHGFPQLVRSIDPNGVVTPAEGDLLDPVRTIDGQVSTGHAFLDDIAHNANPDRSEVADNGASESGVNNISVASHRQAAGTYDNELLDKHYITGDGRGNENIGLTAVHHVFHSEHNRQVDLIKSTILAEGDLAFLNEWLDQPLDALPTAPADIDALVWNGERLFQAAKFPTEMQYQHLVFEEFARKVQPAVNVFNDYDATLDPAILGEFAHTVYRFGHSMLNETVDRYNPDWSVTNGGADQQQIGLIQAFLNPLEFAASGIDAEAAAGAIARGMTRQRGEEIDEFVTEALRNNLVGLPLDLAAINIARGRETGVPSLNEARAEFFRGSGDTQVKPYESWFEFAQNLKNPASVVNFIAAYGTHGSITSATTVAAKRDAAMKLVFGDETLSGAALIGFEQDRLEFLNARGDWSVGNDATLGGLNKVDFWIGGLAEKKLIFGGMLGSSFNFVFETQLEALQNGDRFYYLSRLANLNLTAQLENNKFSEMIHRNTNATHLPGDAFARPDFFLEADLSKQFNADLGVGIDPTGGDVAIDPFLGGMQGGTNAGPVLRTDADGNGIAERLEYTGAEHVVLGGTEGDDHLVGGLGDDTLWGDAGDDRMEGGDGNDFFFGGVGNDIITDLFGVNEIRSQAGDDIISVGPGLNLIITDTGNDVVFGGRDDDEILAGQGDDFVNGGDGVDFTIGGEGSDWLESGNENGLMLGDNGDLVQGLPIKIGVANPNGGNDIMIAGRGGNADMDAEAGDDIMVAGPGTDRFFGAQGFDWVSHKNATSGVEADMDVRLFQAPVGPNSPSTILDRYATVEGLSGSEQGDILRGDSRTLNAEQIDIVNPELDFGDPLSHRLSNVDLIDGLREFLPFDLATNANIEIFDGGNILMGGGGSDILEGRGGDDLIDGDHYLNVRIEVSRDASRGQDFQVFSIASITEIRDRMLTGEIKASQLRVVREILRDEAQGEVDVAEFSGLRAHYLIEGIDPFNGIAGEGTGVTMDEDGDGFISIRHIPVDNQGDFVLDQLGADGHDRLKIDTIERLRFADQTFDIMMTENFVPVGNVIITGDTIAGQTIGIDLSAVSDADNVASGGAITQPYTVYWQGESRSNSGIFENLTTFVVDTPIPVTGPTLTLTDAMIGLNIRAAVQYVDGDKVIERVVSLPQTVLGADGSGGALVVPDPAAELGIDLGARGVAIDGAPLAVGDVGILEDLATIPATGVDPGIPAGTPFTFTVEQLLTNIRAANPGVTVDIVRGGLTNVPLVTIRVREGDPNPGTLTFNAATQTFSFVPAQDFFGGITFLFDVLTGAGAPIGAEAVLQVFGINDVPNFAPDFLGLINAGEPQALTFTEVQLFGNIMRDANGNATDVDGDAVRIRPDTVVLNPNPAPGEDPLVTRQGTLSLASGTWTFVPAPGFSGDVTIFFQASDGTVTLNMETTLTVGMTFNGDAAADIVDGTAAGDILNGGPGNDQLNGGPGNDIINGGDGDDTITQLSTQGRDIIDGGAQATPVGDLYILNGIADGETFKIVTVAVAQANLSAAQLGTLNPATEIVVLRQTGDVAVGVFAGAAVIAELRGIEEISINGAGVTVPSLPPAAGGDTIQVIGDFNGTSLNFNTIRISGAGTVDITGLASDHRIVVEAQGPLNLIGELRPQDVLILPEGVDPASVESLTVDGVTTLTTSAGLITFTGFTTHIIGSDDEVPEDTQAGDDVDQEDDDTEDDEDGDGNSDAEGAGGVSGSGSGSGSGTGSGSGSGAASGAIPGVLFVGTGDSDTGFGGHGDDRMSGGAGDDALFGYDGDDSMVGGDGADELFSGKGHDIVLGGSSNDRIFADAGNDMLLGGEGNDHLDAGDGNDQIWGDQGRDVVKAGLGNDVIFAMAGDGNDVYDGGDGIDTADYSAIATGIVFDLDAGIAKSVGAGNSGEDVLKDIENIVGGSGNDTFYANNAVNVFEGGGGNDTFVFRTAASANGDRIEGFAAGDVIKLSNIFGEITESTFVDNGTFTAAGQIRLVVANGDTRIEGNIDGDADADFSLTVEDYLVRKDEII